jgi:hypothetical protein
MTAPSPSLATIRKDGGDDEEEDMLEEGNYGNQFGPLDQLSSEIRPSTTSVGQFRVSSSTKNKNASYKIIPRNKQKVWEKIRKDHFHATFGRRIEF